MATQAEANGVAERFGLTSTVEREADGRPVLVADEELSGTFPNVSLLLGGSSQGVGTLFVSSRRVIWTEATTEASTGHAYSIAYPSIAMHAVSSGLDPEQPAAQQRPCIYMQLDPGGHEVLGAGDNDEEDAAVPELHLVPADPSTRERLEAIFAALCECASKHPDPEQEDDEGDFFFDEDEVMAGAGAEARAAQLQHLDDMLDMPHPEDFDQMVGEDEGRFDDAEEEGAEEAEGEQEQPRR